MPGWTSTKALLPLFKDLSEQEYDVKLYRRANATP